MIYPNDIIDQFRARLSKIKRKYYKPPKLPSNRVMSESFEVAYDASFLTEERRKLRLGIIFASAKELSGARMRVLSR